MEILPIYPKRVRENIEDKEAIRIHADRADGMAQSYLATLENQEKALKTE